MKRYYLIGLTTILLMLVFALTIANDAQAAPTFQGAGAGVSSSTGAVNPAWPAHQVGDIALLFVESPGGRAATLSTSAGFVAVTGSPQATGGGVTGTQITVFWARATSAAMATPTVADPGDHVYAQILTYRGVIATGDPWDVTGGGVKASESTSVTVTGITTTAANTLIVQAVSRDNDSQAAAFDAQTNANLTSIAERADAGTDFGNGGGFAVWDGVMAAAGAIGNTTATVTSSVNAFLTIALKPPPPPPAGVSDKIAFLQQPTDTTAGVAITPAVTVEIQDSLGNRVNDNTTQVTITIGLNPGGGNLTGGGAVTAVAGVATFSNLSIDKAGTGYTLVANAPSLPNPNSPPSNPFDIRGPSKLAFSVQPTTTAISVQISPAVEVQIQDSLGNLVPIATDSVTIAKGPGSPAGTLGGTLTVSAVAGVATFSNLTIDTAGSNFMLRATSGILTLADSTTFNILAGTFGLTQCIADRAGSDFPPPGGCSAGDVGITKMEINPTTLLTYCIGGETLILDLKATLEFGPTKYDIGIFIANDGKTLRYRSATGGSQSCTVKSLPTSSPFTNSDGDACGDSAPSSPPTYPHIIYGVPIVCQASCASNGQLFIPFSTSWDIGSSRPCSSGADVIPIPNSKCNIPNTSIGTVSVAILPKITKTDNRTTVSPGESTQYTVVITNNIGVTLPSLKCDNGLGSCCGKTAGQSCDVVTGTCIAGDSLVFKDPAVTGLVVTSDPILCSASGGATCPVDLSKASMQGAGITIPNMPGYGGRSIMGITKANPAVVTYSPDAAEPVTSLKDPYANGDIVIISDVVGMTEVNGKEFTVANVNTTANTFQLLGVDSSAYTAYSSGGTILKTSRLTFTITATVSSTNPPASFTNTATVMLGCSDGTGSCVGKIDGEACGDATGVCRVSSASDTNGGSGSGSGGSRVRVIKWREVFQ